MEIYHLVHFNLAIAREALDHPRMADFMALLEPVNQLARMSPGFVWTPEEGEAGDPVTIFGSERALPNLSVWQSLDDLRRFVYGGLHGQALENREAWFETPSGAAYVLWWIPPGHRPDLVEAKQRLDHLVVHGPTPHAFTFSHPFGPPDEIRGTTSPSPSRMASSSASPRPSISSTRTKPPSCGSQRGRDRSSTEE